MPLPLASIDQDVIREWYAYEATTAPIQAARAVAMLSGFLGWYATKKDLRELVNRNAARARARRPRLWNVDLLRQMSPSEAAAL